MKSAMTQVHYLTGKLFSEIENNIFLFEHVCAAVVTFGILNAFCFFALIKCP
jgi:hypothetical protein